MNRKIWVIETLRDITNPDVDRRHKGWEYQPVIKAGSRFIVQAHEKADPTLSHIIPSDMRFRYSVTILRVSKLGRLIEANAVQVPPRSVQELSEVYDCAWGGDAILEILVRLGRVTAADFEAVAVEGEREERAREEARS